MRAYILSSGRLPALFVASALCMGGVEPSCAGQQIPPRPAVKQRPVPKQIALAVRRQQAPPTQKTEPPVKGQYGDITISDVTTSEYLPNKGSMHWVGKYTEIVVPDKASKSVLTVHGDDILVSPVGKKPYSLVVLEGNVRYHLVQKTETGDRVLDGTAGHAVLQRVTQRMEFTGGVRAKVTDAARFSGPANLRTGTLNVAMETKPFRYNLAGPASVNDIQFTPMQAPVGKDGKPGARAPVGAVHIFGFRSGDLQIGQSIHVQGSGTTCEFASPDQQTAWKLQGDVFEGVFLPDQSDLQRATVTDNVRFHLMQPSADKKSKTTADGTAIRASYVRTPTGQETVMHGPLHIDFIDPQHLEEPGFVTSNAENATLTLKKSGDSLAYSLEDPDHTAKMQFTPKAAEPDAPKPPTPSVKPAVPPVPK